MLLVVSVCIGPLRLGLRDLASHRKYGSVSEQGLAPSPALSRQQVVTSVPRLSEGVELLGERESYGFKEPVYLARRGDGQFLRLSRLLHLVAAEADGQKDYGQIALRVSREFGRPVSADNVRFLVEQRLRLLGVVAGTEGTSGQPAELPRAKPVLALQWRAPILPAGAARVLAAVFRPLFFPPLVVTVLAGFAALDLWRFFLHRL